MHPWSKRGFFCFVLFVFSFYIIGALVYFNNFNDEKNYISKASFLKKRDHGAPELLQKQNTLIYTRYRSNYQKKNKYKETSLWKVSSPNKTDCVNLLIFFPERTQEERTKKIQNKLKYRNKKFLFLPCSHLSPMKPTLHIKQMYLLLVNPLTQVMF